MSSNNFRLYLTYPKLILNFFGVWPREGLNWHREILLRIYAAVVLFDQYSFLLFEFMYIANVLGDMDELSEASFLLLTQASLCYKATVFLVNKKNLMILVKLMEQELFLPQNKIHEKRLKVQAQKIRRLCFSFLMCAGTTCSLWALTPLFDKNGPRFFPFKIWMPVNPERSPDYQIGYLYQILSIYISALLFIGVDSITVCTIMFGSAQLEIIGDKLKGLQSVPLSAKLRPQERKKCINDNNQLFVECVKQHQAVIRFVELVENTYHAPIFFQLSGTVAIICIIGLRISLVEPNSFQFFAMIFYMMTMMSQLFLYCWCGEELTIRSERLREWLYQCPWYDQDVKFRRSLWIALERMKRPIIFKAGHYIALSRPTFVSILRSSYSYFAVLKQANSK